MRAFLAIPVLPPALAPFQELRARLVDDVAGVRWSPGETAHITLHFFGSIGAERAEGALALLRPVLAVHPALRLCLRGLGTFPSQSRPRVLWLGVDDEGGALDSCARACRDVLEKAGFAVDERPYRAHCTLGRPRDPWPAAARESWWRHVQAEPSTPPFTANRAVLYESLSEPSGVRHVPREVLRLRQA